MTVTVTDAVSLVTLRRPLKARVLAVTKNVELGSTVDVEVLQSFTPTPVRQDMDCTVAIRIPLCCADALDRYLGALTCDAVQPGCSPPTEEAIELFPQPVFVDGDFLPDGEVTKQFSAGRPAVVVVQGATRVTGGWIVDSNALNVIIEYDGTSIQSLPVVFVERQRSVVCTEVGAVVDPGALVSSFSLDLAGLTVDDGSGTGPQSAGSYNYTCGGVGAAIVALRIVGIIGFNGMLGVGISVALGVSSGPVQMWRGRGDLNNRDDPPNWMGGAVPRENSTVLFANVGQPLPPTIELDVQTVVVGDEDGILPTRIDLKDSTMVQLLVRTNSAATGVVSLDSIFGAPVLTGTVGDININASMASASLRGNVTAASLSVTGAVDANDSSQTIAVTGDLTLNGATLSLNDADLSVGGTLTTTSTTINATNSNFTFAGALECGVETTDWNLNGSRFTATGTGVIGTFRDPVGVNWDLGPNAIPDCTAENLEAMCPGPN
jgi:uncharacterized glyoxalase superfamily protein PhnB